MKLGRFYVEDLDFYLWRRSLAAKLSVSGSMDLVADMSTYIEMQIMPYNLGS